MGLVASDGLLMFAVVMARFLWGIAIVEAVLAVAAFVRHLFREEYADALAKLEPAALQRLMTFDTKVIALYKISLWLLSVTVWLGPVGAWFYQRDWFQALTAGVVLLYVIVWQDFLFRRWLQRRLRNVVGDKSAPHDPT